MPRNRLGEWSIIPTRSRHVLALLYQWRGNSLVSVHNLDGQPHELTLNVPDERARVLANLIDPDESVADQGTTHKLVLDPYDYRWYRMGGFDYAVHRQ
jgi:maltose alpha-D-glucosyltransferase/alpha-amylase